MYLAKLIENKEEIEKVILVAVSLDDSNDADESLDELEELVNTAGAQVVGRTIQNREAVHPGTYVGKGKVEELKDLIWETQATAIVCDDELTPAQYKNLEDELNVKVMDICKSPSEGTEKLSDGKTGSLAPKHTGNWLSFCCHAGLRNRRLLCIQTAQAAFRILWS